MGCCCSGLPEVSLPKPPPPPICVPPIFKWQVHRSAQESVLYPCAEAADTADITTQDAAAWTEFDGEPWEDHLTGGRSFPSFGVAHTISYPKVPFPLPGTCGDPPPAGSGEGNWFGSQAAASYYETRAALVIPLIHEIGGTQYSIEELYGLTSLSLVSNYTINTIGFGALATIWVDAASGEVIGANGQRAVQLVDYHPEWTTYDVSWGLLSNSDLTKGGGQAPTSLSGFGSPRTFASGIIDSGLTDIASTSLSTGQTLTGASLDTTAPDADNVVQRQTQNETLTIPLDSIAEESGDDYLLILVRVSPSQIAQQTVAVSNPFPPDFPLGQEELWGPNVLGGAWKVDPNSYSILEIWGCINSIDMSVDIDTPSGSSIENEIFSGRAQPYTGGGSGIEKNFRLDKTSGGITRTCYVYLTEDSGTYYLNFELHREDTATADENWYIDPTDNYTVAVGPGETYETIDDIEISFPELNHDGSDNVDTGLGEEDADITFTITSVNIGSGV